MSKGITFLKMHGLGNDFVIFKREDLPQGDLPSAQAVQKLCDRHRGIGCDQLIVIQDSNDADIQMHIYNPDGSRPEACGNATRCVAALLYADIGKTKDIKIKTDGGILIASRQSEQTYSVNMARPNIFNINGLSDVRAQFNLSQALGVNIGNPHCVFFTDYSPNDETLAKMGRAVETHSAFPQGTNVEFVTLQKDGSLRMRVWERGAGVTQACGSGACAAAAVAIHKNMFCYGQDIAVLLDGGSLILNWPADDAGIVMTGPAAHVFEGQVEVRLFLE